MVEQTNNQTLPIKKIVLFGVTLAVGSIVTFGVLWVSLGWLGVANLPRLVVAVCTPPGLMTIASVWLYLKRGQH